MCPLCIGTATWLVSSGTSAGGIAAFILRRTRWSRRVRPDLKGKSRWLLWPRGWGARPPH